jgi:hypothetical protein
MLDVYEEFYRINICKYLEKTYLIAALSKYFTFLFTQPLTEMITRNIKLIMVLGSKVRPVRRADNLTAIFEPNVQTMWDH